MLVPVAAALLDEHGLVDADFLEMPQMRAQLIRRADAVIGAGRRQRMARLLEIGPDVGAARLVLAEDVVVRQAVAEEAQAVLAAAARLHLVRVHGEAGHHRDVGIDRVPDRHALLLEDAVVVVDPLPRLARVDEREGQRADAERAAILMVSRLEQATHSGGCGFCTGFGTTLRHGMSKNSPLKPG